MYSFTEDQKKIIEESEAFKKFKEGRVEGEASLDDYLKNEDALRQWLNEFKMTDDLSTDQPIVSSGEQRVKDKDVLQ